MKAVLITCAILCIFGVAVHQVRADEPVENPITDEQGQCIIEVLSNTEVDTEHVGGMAGDIVETFARLIQQYFRCEEILSDPPTALEQRRHEACRIAWYATVISELWRLRNQSQALDFFDYLLGQVEACRAL